MSILEQKINPIDIETAGVTALPDVLTGSAEENKKLFDRLVRQVVSQRFNALVEELASHQGAAQIGAAVEGVAGATVQEALKNLKKDIDGAAFEAGSVSSVFGRAGNVAAQKGDYTPDQVGATPTIHSVQVTVGTNWAEEDGVWTQPFVHELVTANTRVDLCPGKEALKQLREAGTAALFVENTDGIACIVALGSVPAGELVLQADLVEVKAV